MRTYAYEQNKDEWKQQCKLQLSLNLTTLLPVNDYTRNHNQREENTNFKKLGFAGNFSTNQDP